MNLAGSRLLSPVKIPPPHQQWTLFPRLFSLMGFPSYVHTDRGASFISKEFKDYMHSRGIATSNSTPYHPTGNSQCERFNQTIWKTVSLMLKGRYLSPMQWEEVLPEALHSVRTLLCTTTNSTPPERFFYFPRRSMLGRSLPSWLVLPGLVLLKKFVRNKQDPFCEKVELIEANPNSALIRFRDGRETTVSTYALLQHLEQRKMICHKQTLFLMTL